MRATRKKKVNKLKLLIFSIIVIGIFALCTYNSYKSDLKKTVDPSDTSEISFQIKKGTSVKEIANNLEENNLIVSASTFYRYTKINSLGEKIIAGRFLLSKSMTIPQIVEAISDPSKAEFIITIQEGLRIKDIDQKLVELDLIEPNEFITAVKNFTGWQYYSFLDEKTLKSLDIPLEGYIYPDTYFLDPASFEASDLIYLALDNFEKKFKDLQPEIKNHSYHEIITMASIIENEVFGLEDRKLVSGILWKRLENSWPLGADATLLYITDDRKITQEDLEKESSYNTRKNLGLPPGPISNPSRESIVAAMYPESSNNWFYLTTPDTGEVIYSYSNEEHNQNKSKYLH